jgi:ABC-type phosphate transport system substrate-binding protein
MAGMKRLHTRLLAALLLALSAGCAQSGDLVVIVAARSPIESLKPDQVAAIFLGQSPRFPSGALATALDQPIGSPERDQFYQRVTGKSPALLKAYWSKMVFTGRGQPPRELAGSAAVRRAVAEDPALIGYIEREALDPSVRPVLLLH